MDEFRNLKTKAIQIGENKESEILENSYDKMYLENDISGAERSEPNEKGLEPTSTTKDINDQKQKDLPQDEIPIIISRKLVVCYHQELKLVYQFDFWDTQDDFTETSASFNKLLGSVRFLN